MGRSSIWALSGIIVGLILTLPPQVWSSEIIKVKGKNVLLSLDEAAQKGDVFEIITYSGKKKGLIRITAVKGGKAKGKIIKKKGKIKKGWTARLAQQGGGEGESGDGEESSSGGVESSEVEGSSKQFDGGVLLGMSSDTLHVSGDSGAKVNATGTGNRVGVFVSWHLPHSWSLQGQLGLFTMAGKYSGVSYSIGYLDFAGWARYHIQDFWAGLGARYLSPSSQSGIEKPESTSVLSVGFGYDFGIGAGFVPIELTYDMVLGANGNLAESIALCLGYGFRF